MVVKADDTLPPADFPFYQHTIIIMRLTAKDAQTKTSTATATAFSFLEEGHNFLASLEGMFFFLYTKAIIVVRD